MRVEACCTELLRQMLPTLDPQREGVCIDVGVGTFAFYCEMFAQLGFRSVAVEPLPVAKLRRLCAQYPIQLIESCLSDQTGTQPFYAGEFARIGNANFNSLAPDWFGSSQNTQLVPTLSLPDLLGAIAPPAITCLKLDIEGWESVVIQQLADLPAAQLPKVTMFEYGGGANQQAGTKGWSPEFLAGTLRCLTTLQQRGYGQSIMVDYSHGTQARIFDLQAQDLSTTDLFPPEAVYGNIISLQGCHFSEAAIAQICSRYAGGVVNWFISKLVSAPVN